MDNMYKARALAEDLKSELELRGLGTATLSFDADGEALVQLTSTGTNAALIRVTTVPTTARDALGLQHGAFAPHIIQIATRDGANLPTAAFSTNLTAVVALRGARVELYQTTAAPVASDFVAANRVTVFHPSLQFPLTGEM